jgi:hypothetical protein
MIVKPATDHKIRNKILERLRIYRRKKITDVCV